MMGKNTLRKDAIRKQNHTVENIKYDENIQFDSVIRKEKTKYDNIRKYDVQKGIWQHTLMKET